MLVPFTVGMRMSRQVFFLRLLVLLPTLVCFFTIGFLFSGDFIEFSYGKNYSVEFVCYSFFINGKVCSDISDSVEYLYGSSICINFAFPFK